MAERTARVWWSLAAVTVVVTIGLAALLIPGRESQTAEQDRFPSVDRTAMSMAQRRIVDILQAQFDSQPGGQAYSDGVAEPWCANFVSWVMNEAGVGLVNPHSGGWRVPGVYTLQEVYRSTGRFAGPDHRPAAGDVALYAEDSPLGLHANVVIAGDTTTVTTVGGNEDGRIRVRTLDVGPSLGLLGYGLLP